MKTLYPQAVIAYTDTGVAFECAIKYECMTNTRVASAFGTHTERFRVYRVVCEIPWERVNVARFDVIGWPDDVTFRFDVAGMTEAEARQWVSRIPVNELPYREKP